MTAKEYLRSVRKADDYAKAACERLRGYREAAGYGMGKKEAARISGTSQRSRVEDNVCALVDMEREMERRGELRLMDDANAAIDIYADRRAEAEQIIREIPREDYRAVLMTYYIEGKTWPEVSRLINRSRGHTFKLHGWALVVFDRIWRRKTQHVAK